MPTETEAMTSGRSTIAPRTCLRCPSCQGCVCLSRPRPGGPRRELDTCTTCGEILVVGRHAARKALGRDLFGVNLQRRIELRTLSLVAGIRRPTAARH